VSTPLDTLLSRLKHIRKTSENAYLARCPSHDDHEASLSVAETCGGKVLVCCHAGCSAEQVLAALGLTLRDLFPDEDRRAGGFGAPRDARATVQPASGCTLADYAAEKRLPIEFLSGLGLADAHLGKVAVVRTPYRGPAGLEEAVQFRLELHKRADGSDNRFRFKNGTKPCPYGLDRLDDARSQGTIALVEGTSDAQTLWYHGIAALGLPGAASWLDTWADYLEGIARIIVSVEPDKGGETLRAKLATSRIRDHVWLVYMPPETKDASALYLSDPAAFAARWHELVANARPLADELRQEAQAAACQAWECCRELASRPAILDLLPAYLATCGVAGETRVSKLLYLALCSRFFERPVSVAVKGPSSGGKSFLAKKVVELFPESAVYELTAMSEHALAYLDEPMSHRFLVIFEASGLENDFVSYLVRSLLSEGRLRYVTVEKTTAGLRPREMELEGPTGLLVTTTAVRLHPENETRLLSVTVTDTQEQTRAVFRAIASRPKANPNDAEMWRNLQVWLEGAEHRVAVPFAGELAELVPPIAVRLRRDFDAFLSLIRAHALIHQATREREADGQIVATPADYAAVRELVADLVAEGVEQAVSATTRETVQHVTTLLGQDSRSVTYKRLAAAIGIDKSAAQRRARVALDAGYLRNEETRRGQPAKLMLGDPLPEMLEILPAPERVGGCTVARKPEGLATPQPHVDPNRRELLAAAAPDTTRATSDSAKGPHAGAVDDNPTRSRTMASGTTSDPSWRSVGETEAAALRKAAAVVVGVGAASIALLVKRLGLHEADAVSVLDTLHAAGIVGPNSGGRARPVLASPDNVDALLDAYLSLAT
jgi:hypothetical protein